MKHLGIILLAISMLLLALLLALAMLLQAGAALASALNVSGLVCLLALLLPLALAGAAGAGYAYAQVQERRRSGQVQPSQALATLPGNPPTVFVVRPTYRANTDYRVSPRLLAGSVSQRSRPIAHTTATPMLASIYGFGSTDITEGREDDD